MNDSGEAGTRAPAVSVGMPVFNGETYVEVAISSVLAQTFDDLELVICDNASTDRTAEICQD
jgi:glycosyltransferase involved in cell wall biosynthesis